MNAVPRDETLDGKVRTQILDLLAQFGTLSVRELSRMLDDLPLTRVEEHLRILRFYGWILPVDGYRLTTKGRATRVR